MMAFRIVSVLALTLALAASQAQAQTQTQTQTTDTAQSTDEMVVTTPAAAAAPPSNTAVAKTAASTGTAKPMTTDEQLKAWINDAPKLDHTPSGDTSADANGNGTAGTNDAAAALRQIHGSAGVSVGSNGYSSAYVSTLIPIGKDGTLGLAVSQADYGGGTVDHGRYRLPRGHSQSVDISLQLGNGDGPDPENCVPGFRDGDRYIEPVWVTRLHPELSCTTETDKHAETDTSGQ